METRLLYYICGTGRGALENCYRLLDYALEELPNNPDDFDVSKYDGLVTYLGVNGLWEATLEVTASQAELLRRTPGIAEVSIIPVD